MTKMLNVFRINFFLTCISFLLAAIPQSAQAEYGELEEGYYVVVGVFSSLENTRAFNHELRNKGYTADYAFSALKKLHYCYVLHCDSLKDAKTKYAELKKLSEFSEAWILRVHDKVESRIEDKVVVVSPSSSKTVVPVSKAKPVVKPGHYDITHTHHIYKVIVNLHDAASRHVLATIKVIGDNDKALAHLKAHEDVTLHIPKKESQLVHFVCEAFGYHKTQIEVPLGNMAALGAMPNIKISGEQILIDFLLESCQKGDLMVMPNVFFHSNTNIMRMKSHDDLQILLSVMQDNPALKITVHGHTNGNSSGPITKITSDCDNFFAPKQTEDTKGSSMKLSLLRAEAIKMYLLKNGIAAERVNVQGWGGKKMIHKEDSPHYQLNVRVEIEVL